MKAIKRQCRRLVPVILVVLVMLMLILSGCPIPDNLLAGQWEEASYDAALFG